jgi:hypothetical protein
MVKTIVIHVDEKEHEKLVKEKGSMTWHDFLVYGIKHDEVKV